MEDEPKKENGEEFDVKIPLLSDRNALIISFSVYLILKEFSKQLSGNIQGRNIKSDCYYCMETEIVVTNDL